ncbi:unnamed protein product [Bursaphelenchus okinawaensis]|uniref:Transmembrane protein n=1 Tax=Bursaphelenchus okinawaensis TaxID=465554 RepID=A0A811LRM9_9BILA|nr:unnamed protein product [Bursaphelenchus okinawaensis]CAG9127809.1 unnamed protein product [Bursaphelenchus okinawaensis]
MDIVIDGINFQNLSAFSQWKIHQFTENLTLIQYIGNILHLFVNLYFNYGIWKTSLMHPNMKILVMLYYVYHHNKAMIANYQNFAIRYQFSESNETLRVLLPAVAGYGVMILIGSGFSFYSIYTIISTEQNSFDVQMTFQLLYMLADFYGIYFVLYFFVRFRPMKKRLRNHIRWIFKLPQNVANTIKPIDRADGQHQADEYFQQLSNAWNLKVEEKERKVKKAKKNQIKNGKKAFLSEERSTV